MARMGDVNQVQRVHVDTFKPGYLLCPTDLELIVCYLKPKIETGKLHPICRYYNEVNVYNYHPEELAEQYEPYENKWYFLTPRERKSSNGSFGSWKTIQKDAMVFDDATRQAVGKKRTFVYHDQNKRKTQWLMHEYTMNNPNIATGSKKLIDWVLCKIYMKDMNQSAYDNMANQAQNMRI